MRADRTIIVIGGFLFVIGLVVAWNGYGYIEVERGWSMLIAGTVGFCTGLLLVALGLVLHQLAEIASSASKATLLLAKAKTGGLPEISMPTHAPVARDEDLDVQARPVQTRPVLEEPHQEQPVPPKSADPDWEPEWEPQWELEQALAAEARKSAVAAEAEAPEAVEDVSESKTERPLAWTIRKDREDEPVEFEPPAESKVAPAGDEWLYRTISGPLAGIHEHSPAEAAVGARELEAEAPHAQKAPHEPEVLRAQQEHSEEEAHIQSENPVPEEAGSGAARPEVIGHYEAQGAHYTMYADGSIDAETAHGVYRFASMEELKSFIEGQE